MIGSAICIFCDTAVEFAKCDHPEGHRFRQVSWRNRDARPGTLPLSVTGFYYRKGLIGSDILQCLPSPAWPVDGQGTYVSCLT